MTTRFLAVPGKHYLYNALILEGLIALLFIVIYGGADLITGMHGYRIPVHLPFEPEIPLIPAMSLIYVSLFPAFWMAKFILREKTALKALAWTLAAETLIAGVVFLLIPAETVYPKATELGAWSFIYQLADTVNLTYNLVPSLHVTYSFTLAFAFADRTTPLNRSAIWIWAWSMAAATVFTHHHHLADVLTGICLAYWMHKKITLPYLENSAEGLIPKFIRIEHSSRPMMSRIMKDW